MANGNGTTGGGGVSGGQLNGNGKAGTENDNTRELYWQSSEAEKLFGLMTDNDVDFLEALMNERISLLQKVNANDNGYELVILITEDSSEYLSTHNLLP